MTPTCFHPCDISTICPSVYKELIQSASVSIVSTGENKRGPSLSLCTLRGPGSPLWLTTNQKEVENKEARGTRKTARVHTLIDALPFSPSVSSETKSAEDEREKGGEKRVKEVGRITTHSLWAKWSGGRLSWYCWVPVLMLDPFLMEHTRRVCLCVCKVDSGHGPWSLRRRKTQDNT